MMNYVDSFIASNMYFVFTRGMSLHHYLFICTFDCGGPPEGSVAYLTVGLLGGKDPVLISCRNFHTRIPRGLGALWWAPCSLAMIHPNDSQLKVKELVLCLSPWLSSAPHQRNCKPAPQAPLAQK